MPIRVEPLHPLFFARVEGVDLSRPVDDATFAAIQAASDKHAVLLFPGQTLDDEQQLAFTARFGPLEGVAKANLKGNPGRLKRAEMADVSNLDENDQLLKANDRRRLYSLGNQLWHTDASFRAVPARYSLLSARVIPPTGGEPSSPTCAPPTTPARGDEDAHPGPDRRALDLALARPDRRLHGRRGGEGHPAPGAPDLGAHDPGLRSPLALFGGARLQDPRHVDAEGTALLEELTAFATQPQFVHQHVWTVGDLVMWDNRCTMHRGRPYDDVTYKREMHRSTVRDVASTLEQEAAA